MDEWMNVRQLYQSIYPLIHSSIHVVHALNASTARKVSSRILGMPSKSPRKSFSAYFSASISLRVRILNRRKSGTGGHQPCVACSRRNGSTSVGSQSHFRLMVTPRKTPPNASEEAFTSSQRSMSHS